ncbi:MAG: DUF3575 domain-containing protein [Bacteroidales bacterium]|nr:DUF3575 domain-containing protein [Bacteroidales bacterium]
MEQNKVNVVLKVNTVTLPLLVANFGVEIQPLDHWSVNLPVYYSGLDWFSETVKFRMLGVQPEVRYWLRPGFHGLFFNAHATFSYYNIAWGGDYRYQDHARKTPVFGGGLGIGYKTNLSEDGTSPWGIEFGIGGGVLPLHYDYYYNIHNGRLAGEDTHTYWGPDQAFVSFTYQIGQAKKSRK